jgi:hypothetical protein
MVVFWVQAEKKMLEAGENKEVRLWHLFPLCCCWHVGIQGGTLDGFYPAEFAGVFSKICVGLGFGFQSKHKMVWSW